ncbi:hypothetical protein IEQ34_013770 [Dendrobium chrysotoxum]|uniref:Ubiquitin-like protease family profile domain-containing protein n=1 Tax=Dendrobium chrysotoxum TaxID=161865 RepID=A0AAV7GQB6_DENCH|nr:hypothetical protein IEQ34_013770 [Dendrobium chrysotoxum]
MIDVEAIPYTVTHSSSFMDFKGRELISEKMLAYMDSCFAKYTDKQQTILSVGNISVSREVDELITEKYPIQEADYIMCTLCHDRHWTLLVGVVKGKYWAFLNSLPKDHHKEILNDVVQKLHGDVGESFDTDIRIWLINYPSGVPTQINSIDCGMFVCKYMEELVKHEDVDWEQHKNFQDKMTLFRVELAYAILCSFAK